MILSRGGIRDQPTWSRDLRKTKLLDKARIFGPTTKVQTAILEVFDDEDARIEVWRRGVPPHRFRQRLTRSTSPPSSKQAFMDGLPARTFGSRLHGVRRSQHRLDPPRLRRDRRSIRLHGLVAADPAEAHPQPAPQLYAPLRDDDQARAVLGGPHASDRVEPRREAPEPGLPWLAFDDDEERTGEIHEIELPQTGEIRVGVFEIR